MTRSAPRSLQSSLASLNPDEQAKLVASLSRREAEALLYDWANAWARPSQLPPPEFTAGTKRWWMRQCGRGEGKTRSLAEETRARVKSGRASRIGLFAPTASIARDVMIEGESGLLAIHPRHERPTYYPSMRRLVWPNGAMALHYSSDEPDLVRGPQFDWAWLEEVGAWRYAEEFFDTINPGLRLGPMPQGGISGTPKPTKLLRRLNADARRPGSSIVITRGKMRDNAANLSPAFLAEMEARYAGTRLGRQELEGELLEDIPGALWTWDLIEAARINPADLPARDLWERIIIAIDPAVTSGEESDETGIVACCLVRGPAGLPHVYVLRDLSGRYTPTEWARLVVRAYHALGADRVVAETNNGGDLVAAAVSVIDSSVPVRNVTASRGKRKRAEPVAALYEQGRVHHAERMPILEEQMTQVVPEQMKGDEHFDRADALVWGVTELAVSAVEVGVV